MKSSLTTGCCAAALLCLSLSVPLPAPANPFQSIGSGLKKAGTALNPFKKAAPKPAAEPAPPANPKPTVAKAAKPAPVTKKKPTTTTTAATKKTSSAARKKPEAKPVATSTDDKPAEKAPDDETAAPADETTPPEASPPAAPAEIPFGTPVMGRKGLVRSPYAEDQGMVDVTDLPAGAKVKCPFTGKVFRVP